MDPNTAVSEGDLFRHPLREQINLKHPLVRLADLINWNRLGTSPRVEHFRRRASRSGSDRIRSMMQQKHWRRYGGLDATTIERANARSSYLVRAVVAQNYSEQQIIAVAFYKNGLLPARVETNQAQLWDFAAKRALSF